ncbi:MAG: tetratricopeptide repeat protein [Acidobacteriota bacterium]
MADSALSKAAPPPPSPQARAQRRKQWLLVTITLGGVLGLAGLWQAYEYIASAPERAEAQVQAGIKNLSPGRYEQAIPLFDEALSIDPNSSSAYFQRAVANQNLERFDAALADYQAAIQLRPDLIEAMTARAAIYGQKGDLKKSVEELSKVIDRKPTVDAYFQRASNYASLGEHQKAVEDFTWVIQEMRDAPYVYFARAKSKRALGDVEGAAADERSAAGFDRANQ